MQANGGNRLTRRGFLRNTALGAFGLSLPGLLRLEADARAAGRASARPKSLIFLFLYGGPSHLDTWDMKPDAPAEFRGQFRPTPTAVPGTFLCEHLPRMARLARHYSILRTLHHTNRNHQPAGCWLLTGVNPRSDNAGQLRPRPDDPPALGALALAAAPARHSAVPPFVMLPARTFDQGASLRGQTGGWLGGGFDPLLIAQDPSAPSFRVEGFDLQPGVSPERLAGRRSLLRALDSSPVGRAPGAGPMADFQQQAFDLIAGRRGRSPFDLGAEPASVRDRYGRNRFGQGCLLARRLIEAGARVVTVSDCTAAGHHEWDTHSGNFTRLRNTLLPRLDLAYTALLEDLLARGLLEDTVVYLGGEFGRTPRVGQNNGAGAGRDGRDHYSNCFGGVLAGGRTRAGIVYGASDSRGAHPSRDPVTPEDLAATLFAALGLDPEGTVTTREGRPMPLSHGRVVHGLLA
jgi:hypothetical protein